MKKIAIITAVAAHRLLAAAPPHLIVVRDHSVSRNDLDNLIGFEQINVDSAIAIWPETVYDEHGAQLRVRLMLAMDARGLYGAALARFRGPEHLARCRELGHIRYVDQYGMYTPGEVFDGLERIFPKPDAAEDTRGFFRRAWNALVLLLAPTEQVAS